tara:strand:+ start:434 stop:3034 length:2601 start_codon:yes stop_codon:yes gene_type:complete
MANTEKIVVQVVVQGEKDLKKLEKRTGTTTKSFGRMAAGVLGAVAAFRQITQAVGSALRSFRDFEFQMAKVKAITGANRSEFLALAKSAQDLGRSTFFTAQQVAELQTNYGKLGFTTQEILNAQEATLQLATATDSDLARAAIVAGSAVRGFGLDASETQRVVDVMAVAFTSSALDIEKFQTAMTKVAPIAKSAGFSIEDTTAIMAQLSDAGIEASIAGTSLRNILLKMQDPNSDLVKSFGKTIHSLDELVPALTNFSEEGGSLAEIMEVVDLRQAAAFEQMITSRQRTVELRDALEGATGAAQEMARIVGDTLEGSFKRAESATQGFRIAFIDNFGKQIQGVVENFASFMNTLTDFVEIPVSEKLDEERVALNRLVLQLTETNIKEEDRNKLIIKINKEYPDFLKNINTEKTNTKELKDRLKEYNDQLIDRIVLQKEQEKLDGISQDAADARSKQIKAENDLFDELIIVSEKHNISLLDGATASENYTHVKEKLNEADNGALGLHSEQSKSLQHLSKFVIRNSFANQELLEHTEELNKATEDRDALAKRLGITLGETTKKEEENTNQTNENTGATDKNTDSTKANADEKKNLISVEQELLNFRLNEMIQGNLSEEESAKLKQDLLKQELDNLRFLLEQEELIFNDREELLRRFAQVEKEITEDSNKVKDDSLAEDIKRAAMSGESASDAAKKFIRAKIMEAVSAYITATFSANPFLAVVLSAAAGSLVSGVFEKAFDQISFANGGVIEEFANGGMVHGKSHAQGGEKFAVGGRVVELEGGEAVINKRSTAMFRNQLSAMNAAGGGVKFADGGMINQPSFSQQEFNVLGQNQMMGAMGGASKVVVVESDITSVQREVSVVESDAKI